MVVVCYSWQEISIVFAHFQLLNRCTPSKSKWLTFNSHEWKVKYDLTKNLNLTLLTMTADATPPTGAAATDAVCPSPLTTQCSGNFSDNYLTRWGRSFYDIALLLRFSPPVT